MTALQVLVADPYAPTRTGLRVTLAAAGFAAVTVASAVEALDSAVKRRPDVALIAADIDEGMAATRRLTEASPSTAVVVITAAASEDELLAAVLAGAVGYIGKDMRVERLPAIVRAVADGEVALPRRLMRRVLDELRGRDSRQELVARRASAPLTAREWEILQLLAEDASTAVMAWRLGISDVTVRRHVSGVLGKLGVPDRAAAAELLRSSQ